MKSTEVLIWKIRSRPRKGRDAYEVRWSVAGRPFSRTRRTKGLADKLYAQLVVAQDSGERFDTETGFPSSIEDRPQVKPAPLTWYGFALQYLRVKWPHAAPNYRDDINEGLTAVTKALLPRSSGRPSDVALQRALRDWVFVLPGPSERDVPPEVKAVITWVAENSPPLADLARVDVMRGVLDSLRLKLDGSAAASETVKRKRKILVNALGYAVERKEFEANPVHAVTWQKPSRITVVDPRVVANPLQARNLIDAVSYVGGYQRARGRRLVAMYGCMYYAGMRPAEAVGLAVQDCELPAEGWGMAYLHRTRPTAGKKWTRTGSVHDDRGLKNRDPEEVRPVPLPPVLVSMLRWSTDTFGAADDGRIFFNERGGLVGSSTYSRVWSEARELALPPGLADSPLAGRPYDLRHSALSTWLDAGADPTEVAERAGNTVEVLLTRYAKCLHGRHTVVNQRIERLLGEYIDLHAGYAGHKPPTL